jgi:magnesium chelatase subunit I
MARVQNGGVVAWPDHGGSLPQGKKRPSKSRAKTTPASRTQLGTQKRDFPFSAISGQEEMKLALLLAAIDPAIGGVLALGDRGTGKSTAVRALAGLLPPMTAVSDCPYSCDPDDPAHACSACSASGARRGTICVRPVPMVDLPLGASEDRVVGALDIERALTGGVKAFEPGLLARANRGFLYIDEVNLLEDHLVDLLIDVAASGENVVERDGISVRHPARFVLVGSGNPEEGELRPQLLDRFGLSAEIITPKDIASRVDIIQRRDAFERDRDRFLSEWQAAEDALRDKLVAARQRLGAIDVPRNMLQRAAELCIKLGTDGLRGELTLMRAARAYASLQGDKCADDGHLRRVAPACLRHRLRRNPLDDAGSSVRVERALQEMFGA